MKLASAPQSEGADGNDLDGGCVVTRERMSTMLRKLALALGLVVAGTGMLAPVVVVAQTYPQPPPQPPPDQPPPPNQPYPPPNQPYPPQYPGGQYPPEQPPPQAPPPGADVSAYRLRGVISYSVPYFLTIDAGGRRVPVHLHVGTVILPTGLTLVAGMYVSINGYWARNWYGPPSFVADRIVLLR
jgi:hypothetical protein